jgi:thymidylate synthase
VGTECNSALSCNEGGFTYPSNRDLFTLLVTNIYTTIIEQVELQLSREPKPLPKMILNPKIKNIFDFTFEDFTLEGYEPHPLIKGSVAV